MVLEVATITVTPGSKDAFLDAYRGVRHVILGAEGCRSARMTRGVESPSTFVLLVEWDSVQAHDEGFRQTERFAQWRGAIGPHFAQSPHVEHYEDVDE
jgi:heme-degrading monooxygenase HmoA